MVCGGKETMKISWRIWLLILVLILSLLAIRPSFESGVVIKSVERTSPLFEQGLRAGEIIKEINGEKINNLEDYARVINSTFTTEDEVRFEVATKKNQYIALLNTTPDMVIQNVPKTRLKTGLDIQGGARALVKPEQNITDAQLQDLIEVSNNRFNVFGISDVKIRGVSDLSGNKFMLVEVAGATPTDLKDLIAKQGKFEARVGNATVFVGGNQDITSVCRNDATCAGVTGCFPTQGGYLCNFAFTLYLSEE